MRIALVCPYDWAAHGGVRAHVANLARELGEHHHVAVVAPRSGGPDRDGLVRAVGRPTPVPFNRSVSRVALTPWAARRTLAALRDLAPDVVHLHEPFSPLVSAVAAAAGPRPIVATFHAWSTSARVYRLIAPAARRAAARFDALVAVSPAARSFAGEALGLPLGSFRVIPNGVDVEAYAGAQPLPGLADPDRPLVLFVGRLEPRKGLDVAVRAFLHLRVSRPRARLCVVGEGSERRRCQQMIPPAVRPDVLFVGAVDEDEKPRYHASADVFVAPNTGGESFGIVLLEAMAAGLPVVAADIPGFRTVMTDGRQGRFVRPGDALALAGAVDALLGNRRLRQALGKEGRRTAGDYAWPVVAQRLTAVYRQVSCRDMPRGSS